MSQLKCQFSNLLKMHQQAPFTEKKFPGGGPPGPPFMGSAWPLHICFLRLCDGGKNKLLFGMWSCTDAVLVSLIAHAQLGVVMTCDRAVVTSYSLLASWPSCLGGQGGAQAPKAPHCTRHCKMRNEESISQQHDYVLFRTHLAKIKVLEAQPSVVGCRRPRTPSRRAATLD